MAAREVALLVPDVGDDPVARLLDRGSLAALEGDGVLSTGLEEHALKVGVSGVGEVLLGQRLDQRGAPGDGEDGDARCPRLLVETQGRRNRRLVGVGGRDNQGAGRVAEVVGLELRVVGERGLVDVEHDGEVRRRAPGGARLLLVLLLALAAALLLPFLAKCLRLARHERSGLRLHALQIGGVSAAVVIAAQGARQVGDRDRALLADLRHAHAGGADRDRWARLRLGRLEGLLLAEGADRGRQHHPERNQRQSLEQRPYPRSLSHSRGRSYSLRSPAMAWNVYLAGEI